MEVTADDALREEFTPTTATVRQLYANSMDPAGFDRWLGAHDAEQVRELQAENERLRRVEQNFATYRQIREGLPGEIEWTAFTQTFDAMKAERDAAREQVCQRDEVIARVRELAAEWSQAREDGYDAREIYENAMCRSLARSLVETLDGDGR